MDAIFRVDGDRVHVSPNAAGPWDSRMQHGSAPAALAVWAAEAIPTKVAMRIGRVTVDLMRPVPLAALTLRTEVLREGRKIQLCAVRLYADDIVVAAASVLKVRAQPQVLPPGIADRSVGVSGPDASFPEPRGFFRKPLRQGHVAARRARPVRSARSWRDLVPVRLADDRRSRGVAGDARRGRGGFLQRDCARARFP
jgi:hypothetical protein